MCWPVQSLSESGGVSVGEGCMGLLLGEVGGGVRGLTLDDGRAARCI